MTDFENEEDEEHNRVRDAILTRAVARFKIARENSAELKSAITAYLEEGDKHAKSPMELRDYFDISSPGLLEDAGYNETEIEEASALFETIAEIRYSSS